MLSERAKVEHRRIKEREKRHRYLARKKQLGLVQATFLITPDTKDQIFELAKQAGSHEAAIRQLLDLARANS